MFNFLSEINDYGIFDKIYSIVGNKKRIKEIGDVNFKRIETGKSNNLIWVCFLPWRVSFKEAKKIGLVPKNGRVITYEGPIGLANPDPNIAKELLKKIVSDLKLLKLNNFNILAHSIGNYPAFFVANHFNVKKLVSVVPGSKLGACIYDSIVTQEVKKMAIKLGYNNSFQYDLCITKTNPISNLDNLPSDIEIHIATHDFFIPTIYGEELISELIKNRNPKILRYNNKGHVLTLAKFGKDNPY